MDIEQTYDICIIGGGASGLAAALEAASQGASTLILERDVACGLSILATGNGRCNLSNTNLDLAHYNQPAVVGRVFGAHPEQRLASFFQHLGLMTITEDDRLYPFSRRAESVRDALLARAKRLGVVRVSSFSLQDAQYDHGLWELSGTLPTAPLKGKPGADHKSDLRAKRREALACARSPIVVHARELILAAGRSGGALAELFCLPCVGQTPVLCPLQCCFTPPDAGKTLDGIRCEATLRLLRSDTVLWTEHGEVLFRPYGVSGIAAFNLSRRAEPKDTLLIDLIPQLSFEELTHHFAQREEVVGAIQNNQDTWLNGIFAPGLASVVARAAKQLTPQGLADSAKHMRLTISGTTETQIAQAQRGGISIEALCHTTLQIREQYAPHLYACGEALDIDADCGGFNLAWAWLSGISAAHTAYRQLTQKDSL